MAITRVFVGEQSCLSCDLAKRPRGSMPSSEHEAGSFAQSIADVLAAFCPVVNACVMCQWNGTLSEAALSRSCEQVEVSSRSAASTYQRDGRSCACSVRRTGIQNDLRARINWT